MDMDMMPTDNNQREIDMSKLDMDLINTLWRQDIDMGVTREDTYPFKMELELEKSKIVDESDKLPESNWQYDIDSETGEYLPMTTQQQSTTDLSLPESPPSRASPVSDGNLSFEDCLQFLDGFNHDRDAPNCRDVPQLADAEEIEQRWQDLASISELQLVSTDLEGHDNVRNTFLNTTWNNNSLSSEEQNVFAFNATTNGNVNLQNATSPQLPLFDTSSNSGTPHDQQLESNQLLTIDTQDNNQVFSPVNQTIMNSSSELFSPISRFNNMTINGVPSPASSQASSVNLTMLLLEQQSIVGSLPDTAPGTPVQEIPSSATPTPPNESLLLELLNSTDNVGSYSGSDMDSEMQEQDLDDMMDILEAMDNNNSDEDGSVMDLMSDASTSETDGLQSASDNSSSPYSSDELQGATGYNSLGILKEKQSREYIRGGSSPCHSDTESASSLDSNPQTDKIHHNHSYAYSPESSSQKGCRSNDSSRNDTSDDDSHSTRHMKDQKRARELNIPLPVDKIINLPVDNFNDFLKKYEFNTEQIQLIRDIRRRGKNKVAAQNCRKRKISAIQVVEGSVGVMQNEHDKLLKERDKVCDELTMMQKQFDDLHRQVFENMRDRNGDHVDPNRFQLEIMDDGSVILIPRNGPSASRVDHNTDKKFNPN